MKKVIKIIVIVLAAVLIMLQFFQIDRSNLPINAGETLEAAVAVPPDISLILGRSCSDCHTNTTIYPWYSYIQPSGWFLKNHIEDGKRHLNFSIFNTYNATRQRQKLEAICDEVKSSAMPLPSYLWIHRDAGLVDSERDAICKWTEETMKGKGVE